MPCGGSPLTIRAQLGNNRHFPYPLGIVTIFLYLFVGASIARPFQQIDTAATDERCSPLQYCRCRTFVLYYI